MDNNISSGLNNIANLLSLLNFISNQKALSNQDLAQIFDKKLLESVNELEDKLNVIYKQNELIISLLKKECSSTPSLSH